MMISDVYQRTGLCQTQLDENDLEVLRLDYATPSITAEQTGITLTYHVSRDRLQQWLSKATFSDTWRYKSIVNIGFSADGQVELGLEVE